MYSTYDLNKEQLARLLAMGQVEGRGRDPAAFTSAGLLADMLASPLSLDPGVPDSVPFVLGRVCTELVPYAGRPIGELLTEPGLDAPALRALKDYGKILVRRSRTDAERAASTAIYYAAIAAAMMQHHQIITEHTPAALAAAFANLAARDWLPERLRSLIREAQARCRDRHDTTTS
jgi:hypothetical protein